MKHGARRGRILCGMGYKGVDLRIFCYLCMCKPLLQFMEKKDRKRVALVLSSGGARGFAHIGAIEALEQAGYDITSVAGTSMGALIGGMYAAGKLKEVKEWLVGLDRKQVFALVDFSLSMNHVVKGSRVMEALGRIVPDVNIEDLRLPFCAVATDLTMGREVDFTHGSLLNAVRASISVPSFLRPVHREGAVLIDGGIVNPLPLDRVCRHEDDLLVAVNVNAPLDPTYDHIRRRARQRLKATGSSIWKKMLPEPKEVDSNYYSLLSTTFSIMIQKNAERSLRILPPDICVNIPINRFGEFDYDRAGRIVRTGKAAMRQALAEWRAAQGTKADGAH